MKIVVYKFVKTKNMKNILFLFGLIFFINLPVSGTEQTSDLLIYNGNMHILKGKIIFDDRYPIESFFEKFPDKRPKGDEIASYLRRGYVATFEIMDNQLYLKDIQVMNGGTINDEGYWVQFWKSVLNEVFPNQELIKIDWFTGLLVIPDGQRNRYYDYERYTLLEINEGNFMREKQIILDIDENFMKESQWNKVTEYELFKKRQYEAFKKTDEYNKVMIQIKAEHPKVSSHDLDYDKRLELDIFKYSSKILVE